MNPEKIKMKDFDKIIELLEKKSLTENDKVLLNKLLNDDPENRSFFESYKKLERDFLASKHLSIDELGDYVLIKNGTEPQNPANLSKIPLFELHLRLCEKCAEEMKFYNKEFADVENFVSQQMRTSKHMYETRRAGIFSFKQFNYTRYAIGIAALLLIFVSLLVASNLSTSKYYKLASLSELSESFGSRGRNTSEFELGIKALEEKDYQSAIKYLISDIEQSKDDETIFYSHYLLGLTYLETAEKSFLGLFPRFDKKSAELALQNFRKTIELNNSDKFQNINLDAYFFAAKASLMLEDTDSAKQLLQIVVDEKGSKLSEASEILRILN